MFDDLAVGAAADRPALVNLVVNQCRLTVAAYPATISDLASRGYLAISEHGPGNLMFGLAELPPDPRGLAGFERQVLGDVSERLAAIGNAPFHVLADACIADVHGRWEPFEASVREEARDRGLIRSRLNAFVRRVLRTGALGLATAAYLVTAADTHSGHWPPLIVGFFALAIPLGWIGHVASKDRLTSAGTALAARAPSLPARWESQPGGIPGGIPGGLRAGLPVDSTRLPAGTVPPDASRVGSGEDARDVPCLAIDDGNGAWSFEAGRPYHQVALGDLVHVCAQPRSMTLVSATVIGPSAAGALAGTGPVLEPLLTAAEVSGVFGAVVDDWHFSLLAENSAIYRGGGTTLSVTTARGWMAALSRGPARSFGRPLPGLGDEAWLLNGGRTVVVQVGAVVAKLTLSGTPIGGTRDPRVVIGLAAAVAARLAARAGHDQRA
jgi:hypothetical protein